MAQQRRNQTRRRPRYEFKPDDLGAGLLSRLHLTKLQQRQLLRWTLFALVCVVGSILQDVIMSRVSILGATTDLVPCAILLITVAIGSEQGSYFVLIASALYYFTGSAPGPFVIAFLSILGLVGALFRESFWRRGFASDVLCASVAMLAYELATFGTGVFIGLTTWHRFGVFLLTAALSIAVMIPLYSAVSAIDKIGGETWKE